jgi:hypothetical protein
MTGISVTLHSVAKVSPELALFAAVVARAVDDFKAGDVGATVWLRGSECLGILEQIAPRGIDPRALQHRLLVQLRVTR